MGDLLGERLARVARLDATVFEEVAADETATPSTDRVGTSHHTRNGSGNNQNTQMNSKVSMTRV